MLPKSCASQLVSIFKYVQLLIQPTFFLFAIIYIDIFLLSFFLSFLSLLLLSFKVLETTSLDAF